MHIPVNLLFDYDDWLACNIALLADKLCTDNFFIIIPPRDMIDFLLMKNDIDLEKNVADYSITAMSLSIPGSWHFFTLRRDGRV